MRSRFLLFFFLCLAPCLTPAQPFPCDGRPIIAITPSREPSRLFHLGWPDTQQTVDFHPIGGATPAVVLNGLGFRASDGYLYGVHPTQHLLYRVGADGRAQVLAELSLTPDYGYFAGDVTPDGRSLVLLGAKGVPPVTRSVAVIDLEAPGYRVREQPIGGTRKARYCADIAFSPIDGRLWGYDGRRRQLVQIDPLTATMQPVAPSAPADHPAGLGALYFDPFGQLYGYGGDGDLRTLFQIDTGGGQIQALQAGIAATGADGCSCPYTVDLQQRITPATAPACSELAFSLVLTNRSGVTQRGLCLRDTLPAGFSWSAIRHNPFRGKVRLEMERRVLLIEELELEPGTDSLLLTAAGAPHAIGRYRVQATLEGLPAQLGERRRSGNPATAAFQDATPFTLLPADTQSIDHRIARCPDQLLTLTPSMHGTAYRWDDGRSSEKRRVEQGGTHRVTVTYGCQTWIETFRVEDVGFAVDLGPDRQLELGESYRLTPRITGVAPHRLRWSSTPGGGLSCTACLTPTISPTAASHYRLTATSPEGCTATDELSVGVRRQRALFAPNAFSPNNDGNNDFFFLQSKYPLRLRTFQVLDRWGNLLFERREAVTNDPRMGWNGRNRRNSPAPAGAYLYRAVVVFPDGVEETLAGDLLLLR